ncbi:YnhF family membrane protein [Erwinia aphidicola]
MLSKIISVLVAQRKRGILARLRKENEIFTGYCGKIYWLTLSRVIKGEMNTDMKMTLLTVVGSLLMIIAFSITAVMH